MPTYVEIMAQIEALQKQAEQIRRDEIDGVIAEIKQKVRDYDLTAADLGLAPAAQSQEVRPAQPSKRSAVKPKYQDPVSGKTWSGRGVMPKWMKAAVEAGRSRDEFRIASK